MQTITLYDQDGAAFTSNYITSQTEKIKVSVPIYRVNKISVDRGLKDGANTQNQCAPTRENGYCERSGGAERHQGNQPR